ncbi:hypothetical protein DV096_11145 [Bradymonadaceae bacterium TMQ3]|nr:hypothetical protein DV096_11145 [Bradymonadaceae bacterium TMQ3]TXC75544.1 hypothetical protein FRC91_12600 [Bradymonadales bacterium TMQ1]
MIRHTLPPAPCPVSLDDTPRRWLPTPEALVGALESNMEAGEPAGLRALAPQMGAPEIDLTVTPLTARATMLGALSGRAFYHHELRLRQPMPEHLEPELTVWQAGTTPEWSDGVLAEPKYFSFFQDAPFPAFNPNHRRKWRAHELLHGASKFFWHPQMTRFELYVSARLNELLPIIHWYGFDEIFRPRCAEHRGKLLYREFCASCEALARPYWELDLASEPQQRALGMGAAHNALEHLESEWSAIVQEIATGRLHATPRGRLDASSDAVGYMRAHWNRVTAWSTGSWVERFLVDGIDYFSTLDALLLNVGQATQDLVCGTLEVDEPLYRARRTRRQLQDIASRVLVAMEWLDPESAEGERAEDALEPHLDALARACDELLEEPDDIDSCVTPALESFAACARAFSEVAELFPEPIAESFLGFGYRFLDADIFAEAGSAQLAQGIEDGAPKTFAMLTDPLDSAVALTQWQGFDETGRLSERVHGWLSAQLGEDHPLSEQARFEAFANAEPRADQEATLFASLPDDPTDLLEGGGRLRPHATLRRSRFAASLITHTIGQTLPEGSDDTQLPVAAALVEGQLRLMAESDEIARILDHLQAGEERSYWLTEALCEPLYELLENSLVCWLPEPRRASR